MATPVAASGMEQAFAVWSDVALVPLPEGADIAGAALPGAGQPDPFAPGTDGFVTVLRRIGQWLGLEAAGVPSLLSASSDPRDLVAYSPARDTLVTLVRGPSVADIAAAQARYGANMASHAGDDTYTFAPNDPQIVALWDAGGVDTIDVSSFTASTVIDLSPGRYSTLAFDGLAPMQALGIARGSTIENVVAGSGNDAVRGGAAGNRIDGGSGDDRLDGAGGDDVLAGGPGRDVLRGGAGADRFVFTEGDFAGRGPKGADVIVDFRPDQGDRIDLSGIDADRATLGHQAFDFIGTAAFDGHAGQLRYAAQGSGVMVQADTDGDGHPDMALRLAGVPQLAAGDFVL